MDSRGGGLPAGCDRASGKKIHVHHPQYHQHHGVSAALFATQAGSLPRREDHQFFFRLDDEFALTLHNTVGMSSVRCRSCPGFLPESRRRYRPGSPGVHAEDDRDTPQQGVTSMVAGGPHPDLARCISRRPAIRSAPRAHQPTPPAELPRLSDRFMSGTMRNSAVLLLRRRRLVQTKLLPEC